jgi:hypothetical protein
MTALVGDVIIPLSHGFDLGPWILGCAMASIFAVMLATLNKSANEGAIATRGKRDGSVNSSRAE